MNTERDDDSVRRGDDGVDGTTPRRGEQQPAPGEHPEPAEQAEHPERSSPHRIRRSRLTVAAVALAVLLAGGGGAYWATTAGGSASAAPADPGGGAPTVDPGGPMVPAGPVPPSDPNAPNLMKVSGYQADGNTLSLVFYGGVCENYQATADETAGQVRVTVTATPTAPGGLCMALAREFTEKVTLDSPLGTRAVVDTSDGQSVMGQ